MEQKHIFQKLGELCSYASLSPEEQKAYDVSLKNYIDQQVVKETAHEDGYNEGRAEGEAIGLKRGRAEGEAIGMKKNAINTARTLKTMGLTISQIAQATSLSEEEIDKLGD